ncbi:MAG TPA: hypothetical protein VEL79_10230 [Vicinamibacterales bacterium]|nr:hypothetical protein [Vicinamibacterales bacterium]
MAEQIRTHEVRLLLAIIIDLDDPELTERLAQQRQPCSVAQVVADEVVAHLESVSYVTTAIVGRL